MRAQTRPPRHAALLLPVLLWSCSDEPSPTTLETLSAPALQMASPPAATRLVPVSSGGVTLRLWPYTDTNFEATPQDPLNLIFVGQSDPRNIRDALLSLDGNRGGPFAPFACTWTDAIGGQQTAYSEANGWSGSVIQLECGSYDRLRFHIRLFPSGTWTLANAHVDVLIPGTTDHQVLTWELGEQLVTYDLVRSGLLAAAPAQSGSINEAPTFRVIPPVIYNGLPPQLRALTGGPLTGNVGAPVGIPSNGSATLLALQEAPMAGGSSQDFVVVFGQTIPKPFCNAGGEFLRVDGPVHLRQDVRVSEAGELTSQTFAQGELTIRSVDPATGQLGEPIPARVRDHYRADMGEHVAAVFSTRMQRLLRPGAPPQQLLEKLQVGPQRLTRFSSEQMCGT